MSRRSIKDITSKGLGALGMALCLTLAQGPASHAQAAPLTARSLVDRAEIEDLLTRYYWNFGNKGAESFASFYTPDAEMVLGKNSYKGTAGIEGAYKGVPKDAPQRTSYSLNILMSNPLIVVHGDTATAQLVFTETVVDKQGDAPRILTQGREFDHLARHNGQWLISKRQITGPADRPDDWPK
jgi:ketosteroid isomerase-like protein